MVNFNGTLLSDNENFLNSQNRGLSYGDAVFETMRFSGGKIYFWEDHYFRLMANMRILRMEIPMSFTPEFLEDEIKKTITYSENLQNAFRLKLQIWRKDGGKYTPKTNEVDFAISFEKLETPFYTLNEHHYEVELFKDHYVNSGLLSTLKTNNKIINVLGSIYATENEYENCLLLNENKMVVEALQANLFIVNGYKIKTPPLEDGCLNGILRLQILSILAQLPDYFIEIESITPFELQKADEMFLTNTIMGIQPITKYRKKEYKNKIAKELLAKLNLKARLG